MTRLPNCFSLFEESFPDEVTNAWLIKLIAESPWQQRDITLFGKTHKEPRLTAWHGDAESRYRYSGIELRPEPWAPLLLEIKQAVEAAARREFEATFNSVLLNYYRDGQDSMGWHADDEPELGTQPVIASLSLGAARTFRLKHRDGALVEGKKSIGFDLRHGSLLLMHGNSQRDWLHSLPKTVKPIGPRLNLTFRQILTAGD